MSDDFNNVELMHRLVLTLVQDVKKQAVASGVSLTLTATLELPSSFPDKHRTVTSTKALSGDSLPSGWELFVSSLDTLGSAEDFKAAIAKIITLAVEYGYLTKREAEIACRGAMLSKLNDSKSIEPDRWTQFERATNSLTQSMLPGATLLLARKAVAKRSFANVKAGVNAIKAAMEDEQRKA